jgi:triosephosphate isomerase (TIM)
MKKLAAGNWKMNGTKPPWPKSRPCSQAHPAPGLRDAALPARHPDRPHGRCREGVTLIKVGAQDCHAKSPGRAYRRHLGAMLKDAGATHVILGHSERRTDHGETDALVRAKAAGRRRCGPDAIVCIGETEAERDAGKTLAVIGTQIDGSVPNGATAANLVVAYEPVWAIGTGRTPTLAEIAEVHSFLRGRLRGLIGEEANGVRILYGGSVKPSNATDIFAVPHVDGALVGGASLKAADFGAIVAALSAA